MTSYYNLRHDGDQYRCTKFDADLNVESTYLMDATECTCPAGHRPSCRHRAMFATLLPRIGSTWLFDYDHGDWVPGATEDEPAAHSLLPAVPATIDQIAEAMDQMSMELVVEDEEDEDAIGAEIEAAFADAEADYNDRLQSVIDGTAPNVDLNHSTPTHIHNPHPSWRRI